MSRLWGEAHGNDGRLRLRSRSQEGTVAPNRSRSPARPEGRTQYRVEVHNWAGLPGTSVALTIQFENSAGEPGV
jgi:hypothetical protein